jgi:hypothetical protein
MAKVYSPVGREQLQILQLNASSGRDEVAATRPLGSGPRPGERRVMYVMTIHSISDPDAFWSRPLDLPEGTEQPIAWPSSDGTRGVCVFRSDSVNTVRNVVDGQTGKISNNEFFAINEGNAQGLPV